MNIFDNHQLKIARSTLRMHDLGSKLMGGMTKEEARRHLIRILGTERGRREIEKLEGCSISPNTEECQDGERR